MGTGSLTMTSNLSGIYWITASEVINKSVSLLLSRIPPGQDDFFSYNPNMKIS